MKQLCWSVLFAGAFFLLGCKEEGSKVMILVENPTLRYEVNGADSTVWLQRLRLVGPWRRVTPPPSDNSCRSTEYVMEQTVNDTTLGNRLDLIYCGDDNDKAKVEVRLKSVGARPLDSTNAFYMRYHQFPGSWAPLNGQQFAVKTNTGNELILERVRNGKTNRLIFTRQQ